MLTSGTGDRRFINKVVEKSLPYEIRSNIKVFPVGGRYLLKKMSFVDRNFIKIVAFFTKHPETKEGMLTQRDKVHKNRLKELLDFIKRLNYTM